MTITLFATVHAKPEAISEVESALRKMLPQARLEAGCSRYDLFGAVEKPATFQLVETYADEAAVAAHRASPHFAELVKSLAGKLAGDIQIEYFREIAA